MLTMTASRSGRGGVGHMTASCFVFLIASIAPIAELHDCSGCSGCNNCKCCLIVKPVEGVEAVASGEDAAASGRREFVSIQIWILILQQFPFFGGVAS